MFSLTTNARKSLVPSFEQVFDDFFNDFFNADFKTNLQKDGGYPRIDVYDKGNTLVVDATTPGLTKDDVDVSYDNQSEQLVIKVSKSLKEERDIASYKWKEIHRSSSVRTIMLPQKLYDVENIDAKVENGLLTVTVPKLQLMDGENVKKIDVK